MSEYVWLRVRAWLREDGLDTSRRRIAAVVAAIDGADHYIAIDREEPLGDEIVLLILESSDRAFFHICTLRREIGESMPWTLPLGEYWRVVDGFLSSRRYGCLRHDMRSSHIA